MNDNLTDYFSKEGFNLRNAEERDITRLVDIINDAYAYQDNAKGEPRTSSDHLHKRINETDFYAVLQDKQIIGCVYLEPKDSALHFGLLTLIPDFRGKGIAEGIINSIDTYAKNNNFETINLDYMSLAPWLKKYYEKYGFVETGEVTAWGSINLIKMQKKVSAVSKDEVAQYYIRCELDNIVVGDNIQLQDELYCNNLPRLLEALSFTYRANSVFDYVESNQFQWEKREVAIDDVVLTGMSQKLTEVIYSDQVQQNPRKFVEYIQSHPDDEYFAELKPKSIPDDRKIIILREVDGKIKMLDGSHRFVSMIMEGATSILAYVAVPTNINAKPMIGDAIFLRLRKSWQQTDDPEFKRSIEQTVLGLMASSENGLDSVEKYWVAMGPNGSIKTVGQRLIREFNSRQQQKADSPKKTLGFIE